MLLAIYDCRALGGISPQMRTKVGNQPVLHQEAAEFVATAFRVNQSWH